MKKEFKTNEQYVTALQSAKDSGNKTLIREAVVDMLRPEAYEVVQKANKSITTKNGYSIIVQFASGLGLYKNHFVDACILEGFDAETAETVKQII